ncbi:NTP pyrophosphatase, house-cleaning of non-canonical NTPs [Butyrivibrio sp. INlla18]|uniref:MazG nucleotide pyrophosphohydrolase domain-containing protein n=1 Tax=Butyrivibrio sp. INlla18 TaxID=1520806 RepID=UPI00088778D1|nr:MazG-like family protein [Butyrivibrio sp. INlla18]SDA54855.1 NTP pyrophosphatase, house-cleaning of non-canonical NTPs [Butyrivibrio sp. INlla18]
MPDFGINEMLDMQRTLQERYKDKWEGISPEVGKNKLLWMIGEIGEVIDIVKKYGPESSNVGNPEREHLIEELADVLMYYNDVLLCYGITAEELKETYTSKFQKNMKRW